MSFRIEKGDHLAKEVRRIARKQVEGAILDVRDRDHDDPETVHEIRKRCKKVRGLLRLVRPALGGTYDIENAHFRDAARSLSPLRDAHTALVAYDSLLDHYRREVRRASLAAIRRHLVQVEERTKRDTDDLGDRYAQRTGEALRRVQRLIDHRRDESEARARPVGMRLFAEKPRRIAARHSGYWSAWSEEQRCDASMDLGQSAA